VANQRRESARVHAGTPFALALHLASVDLEHSSSEGEPGHGVQALQQAYALGVYLGEGEKTSPRPALRVTSTVCSAATVVPTEQRLQSLRMPAKPGNPQQSVPVRRETSQVGG
jgi:hypothetical protein